MRRRFEELTTADLEEARSSLDRWVAVVPFAATEQHGPHLPLGTDAIIADHMIETVLAGLPGDHPVTCLATLRIGKSAEHGSFRGTLDYGWEVATRGLIDIGRGLSQAGFRRIVFVSSHGGNTPVVDTAALELRRSLGLLVATCSWMRFGFPPDILPDEEIAIGIHGGAVETALMLHFRPDLVRRERLALFPTLQSEMAAHMRQLRAHGRLSFGWMSEDLNPAGVVGDARLASAEIGSAVARHQAAGFTELLDDVLAFDLARLKLPD